MTAPEIRWLALLPDPVTGLDQPVTEAGTGKPKIFVAPNREYAVRLVRAALEPKAFNLAAVVSEIDWLSRRSVPQRSKLTSEPKKKSGFQNPRQTCWCGAPTQTRDRLYCPRHRAGRRSKNRKDSPPVAPTDPADPTPPAA